MRILASALSVDHPTSEDTPDVMALLVLLPAKRFGYTNVN